MHVFCSLCFRVFLVVNMELCYTTQLLRYPYFDVLELQFWLFSCINLLTEGEVCRDHVLKDCCAVPHTKVYC